MTKRVLFGGLSLLLAASLPSFAGVNGGGSIIVHTDDSYTYRSTTICTTAVGEPASCAAAVTTAGQSDHPQVIWFLASFVPEASPRVASVYFGMDQNLPVGFVDRQGFCGPAGSVEISDSGWPSPEAGNSVGFGSPIAGDTLFRFYYFIVADETETGASFCSKINPTGGYASFYDDAFPPVQDNVTRFGCVKWYEAGSNTCPVPPPTGACCLNTAVCQIVGSKNECDALSGTYQGDNTACDTPCSACCYWDSDPPIRNCIVTTYHDCSTGVWSAVIIPDGWGHNVGSSWAWVPADATTGAVCASEPSQAGTMWYCQDPRDADASAPSSWGRLKALYR